MKSSPQKLTERCRLIVCVVATSVMLQGHQLPAAVSADESAQPSASAGAGAKPAAPQSEKQQIDTPAAEILQKVNARLTEIDSLSCDLHQTVNFSGMQMIAAGRYLQASGERIRLDFRLFPVTVAQATDRIPENPDGATGADGDTNGDEAAEIQGALTQVSDGTVLHTMYRNGEQVRVTRRNIRDVLAAAGETKSYGTDAALRDLGVGGIKALLGRIQSDMEFAPVQESVINGIRFYTLIGRWTPDALTRLFNVPEGTEVLPAEHLPEYVRILIDAESLLPRRVQYLKRRNTPDASQVRPIVTLDFRSIELNKAVDDSTFAFTPPEGVTEEDVTEQTIDLIRRLSEAPAASGPQPGGQ
jgi:outer membrane lipoprotein-sorting protein